MNLCWDDSVIGIYSFKRGFASQISSLFIFILFINLSSCCAFGWCSSVAFHSFFFFFGIYCLGIQTCYQEKTLLDIHDFCLMNCVKRMNNFLNGQNKHSCLNQWSERCFRECVGKRWQLIKNVRFIIKTKEWDAYWLKFAIKCSTHNFWLDFFNAF